MANTRLTRTPSSAGNRRTWTFSAWIKRSKITSDQQIFVGDSPRTWIVFRDTDKLQVFVQQDFQLDVTTNMLFRDTSAWYHIVVGVDTTQASQNDRVKIYVNGSLVDVTNSYAVQNYETGVNNTGEHYIGRLNYADSSYFNGSMSHIHLCDGTQYQASDFGEYDANGVWTIKTSPSVTYGTNGFFILKNGNSVTDQSGNSNNWTVASGTLTNTEDCPSNVFATLNPLHIQGTTSRSITYGNTRFYTTTTAWGSVLSTLGFSSGKFYVEAKILTLNSSTGYGSIAIQDINAFGSSGNTNENLNGNNAAAGLGLDYRSGQSNIQSGASTVSSNVGDFSNNDIIGMAIDMDNKALYIHKNGTYYQIGGVTGVPTSGASKTGAITIPASVETCAIGLGSYTSNADFCYNFGNGYFLSTAVSSAGTNASGIGIFEYDVPTGYTALSTKGLNL